MNVVGKVGSLITQGVYSVATPFHPFGGAVDIIVVQQQDGSFRSTPWYVQFGKFQGVLKGAEKLVRINVNGVEADFHMNLDNSGEAYFVKEADSGERGEKDLVVKDEREGILDHSYSVDNSQCSINNDNAENFRLQNTLSDPGILREDYSSFNRLERTDSDACRFYDFQDDQSFDDSVDLSSEYGSSRYDTMDAVENFVEAQGSDSEMVLVSVDGHILTAPISSSEHNTENVPLDTPQFHLGPGKGNGFCEEVNETAWDSKYLNDLNASSSKPDSVIVSSSKLDYVVTSSGENCALSVQGLGQIMVEDHECHDQGRDGIVIQQSGLCHDDGVDDKHGLLSCEENAEPIHETMTCDDFRKTGCQGEERWDMHEFKSPRDGEYLYKNGGVDLTHEAWDDDTKTACQVEDDESVKHQGRDFLVLSDIEITSPIAKNEDKFKSCLDLTKQAADKTSSDGFSLGARDEPEFVEEKCSQNIQASNNAGIQYTPETSVDDGSVSESKIRDVVEAEEVENSSPALNLTDIGRCEERVHQSGANDLNFTPNESALVCNDEPVTPNSPVKSEMYNTGENLSETIFHGNEDPELHTSSSPEQTQGNVYPSLDISLCRHLLRSGMGLSGADEVFNAHCLSEKEYRSTASSVLKNENLVIRYKGKYFSWDQAAPFVLGMAAFGSNFTIESKNAIPVEEEVTSGVHDSGSASGRRWRLWSIPFRRGKTLDRSTSNNSEDMFVDSESVSWSPSINRTPTAESGTPLSATPKSAHKKIIRTNIPTNEQISSLNLKEGQNNVTFSFSTRYLGLQQVEAHIYLWKWNARIVISDVDGTITRSDVLGQFMPLVGKDWSQSGVARLFSAIKENGYQLLFLSARAIVQAYLTKSFLFNLKQDGKTLPTGPVVISPNGLFPSLFREVIRRAPHEFKIACLEDIKALFPTDYNPFYAGFGNRDTDELTYRKLGIPKGKIFIINPKGEVAINHQIDVKSYTSLHTLVHDMFPPTSMVEQEDFNSWNYWKMPMPDIDD